MDRAAFIIFLGLFLVAMSIFNLTKALSHITVNQNTKIRWETPMPQGPKGEP